jgi:hypothetical protein
MRTRTKLHIPGAAFRLGDLVKDELTGFEGIATTHQRHLTGCDGVWITSQTVVHEGKSVERCFDVLRVQLVESNPLKIEGFPDDVPAAG